MRLSFPAILTRTDLTSFKGATGPLASLFAKIGSKLPNIFNGALSLYMNKTTGKCFPRLDRVVVNLLGYSRRDPALAAIVGVGIAVLGSHATKVALNSTKVKDFKNNCSNALGNTCSSAKHKVCAIYNSVVQKISRSS